MTEPTRLLGNVSTESKLTGADRLDGRSIIEIDFSVLGPVAPLCQDRLRPKAADT